MNSSIETKITFQLPDELSEKIKASAAINNRSLNAEIIHLAQIGLSQTNREESKDVLSIQSADEYKWYLKQQECNRVTAMYREALEYEYGSGGEAILSGIIPLGNRSYAFINERNKVVWSHVDEVEIESPFLPSMWDIEKGNWSQFSEERHPLSQNDLAVIDLNQYRPLNKEQSKSTSRPKG